MGVVALVNVVDDAAHDDCNVKCGVMIRLLLKVTMVRNGVHSNEVRRVRLTMRYDATGRSCLKRLYRSEDVQGNLSGCQEFGVVDMRGRRMYERIC